MKIAIIGGGWVGCHLAIKLIKEHNVTIFERNNSLFNETSYNNQNRLHIGYHYARNSKTRNLCKDTFSKFESEYNFLTTEIPNNFYCVPNKKSLVDFETYLKIFDDYDHKILPKNFMGFEGCLNTKEKHINFDLAKSYFNEKLKDIFICREILKMEIPKLKKEYDLVINCTNNFLKVTKNKNHFYELTVSFIYKKIENSGFDGLTLVDGDLFSIYPYDKNLHTVTDVSITPIKKFKTIENLKKYSNTINQQVIHKKQEQIEKKITSFYPLFLKNFKYHSYFLSTKSKILSMSDDRSPSIDLTENLVNIFTGKIQGIYLIEEYIFKLINSHENFNR